MNSALGLHAPCQAATAKVLRHAAFYAHPSLGVIHIKLRKIFARWAGRIKTAALCLLLAQLKQMHIARFLCTLWGKSIRLKRRLVRPSQYDARAICRQAYD
jgi:hypothetical protein